MLIVSLEMYTRYGETANSAVLWGSYIQPHAVQSSLLFQTDRSVNKSETKWMGPGCRKLISYLDKRYADHWDISRNVFWLACHSFKKLFLKRMASSQKPFRD